MRICASADEQMSHLPISDPHNLSDSLVFYFYRGSCHWVAAIVDLPGSCQNSRPPLIEAHLVDFLFTGRLDELDDTWPIRERYYIIPYNRYNGIRTTTLIRGKVGSSGIA